MTGRIVLQETDQDVLLMLTEALKLGGFEVFDVLECDETLLELIERNKPHVIVLDFRLSGEVCVEALLRIRERYPHLPVIALSCNSNINEEYDRYGFDDYIRKPCDLDLLYSILRAHIPSDKNTVG